MKRKLFIVLALLLLFFHYSGSVYAQTPFQTTRIFVESGYTADGIYFEVYDIITEMQSDTSSKYITQEIVYNTILTPNDTITCSRIYDGVTFSGTLNLYKYQWTSGETHAFYQGYIYAQS